jgi:hypothetical protein
LQSFPPQGSEALPVLPVHLHAIPAVGEVPLLLDLEHVLIALAAVEQCIPGQGIDETLGIPPQARQWLFLLPFNRRNRRLALLIHLPPLLSSLESSIGQRTRRNRLQGFLAFYLHLPSLLRSTKFGSFELLSAAGIILSLLGPSSIHCYFLIRDGLSPPRGQQIRGAMGGQSLILVFLFEFEGAVPEHPIIISRGCRW